MVFLPRPMARSVATALSAILVLGSASVASGQVTAVGTRAELTGPTINWGSVYAEGPVNQGVFTPTGIAGLSVRPFSALAVNRFTEGFSWSGGFSAGEGVLAANMPNGGALGLLFNTDILAFGANLQSQSYGAFTGRIEAWDAVGNLLGGFTLDGTSSADDGSAPFLGIRSSTGIRLITFDVSFPTPSLDVSLGINQATIEMASVTTVPEPSTIILLAAGLSTMAVVARRRTRRYAAHGESTLG